MVFSNRFRCFLFCSIIFILSSASVVAGPAEVESVSINNLSGGFFSAPPIQGIPLDVHSHWNYGPSTEVAMKGDTAFTNCGAYLQIFDCTDKNNPVLIGWRWFPRIPEDIEVQGDYAFVTLELAGMTILDISDPSNPDSVGSFGARPFFAVGDVSVNGNIAITTAGKIEESSLWMGIYSLDITDPSSPTPLDSLECFWDDGEIAVLGDYLYVYDGDSLRVVDISNPYDMTLLPSPGIPLDEVEDMVARGNYLYIANGEEGLLIIDITDPENPSVASSCKPVLGTYSDDISVWGNYAYIAKEHDMAVYDISDPYDCWCVDENAGIDLDNDDIEVIGDYAFLAGWDDGFYIVDVEFPNFFSLLGRQDMPGATQDVVVSGDYIYTVNSEDGLRVFGKSPLDTLPGASIKDKWPRVVTTSGNFVYAGSWAGLTIVDITNPLSLVERGNYSGPNGEIHDIVIRADTAYVAWAEEGFIILNVADPDVITEIGSYDTPGEAEGIAVSENYAYIADGKSGLVVVNISDPTNPTPRSILDIGAETNSIALKGDYAYLGTNPEGFAAGIIVVDISNPADPDSVGELITGDETYDLKVLGNYLYTGDYGGLKVLDISDPVAPHVVQFFQAPDECYGIDYEIVGSDTLLYLACDMGGLTVINTLTATFVQSYNTSMVDGMIRVEWNLTQDIPLSEISIYRKPEGGDTYTRLDASAIHQAGTNYWFLDSDFDPGADYTYRLTRETGGEASILFEVEFNSSVPRPMTLSQNRPNPFNPTTVIPFYIPEMGNVSLNVYDANGKLVSRLVDEIRAPGHYNEEWNGIDNSGRRVASGVYFCRLVSNKKIQSMKMVLMR